MLQNFIQNGNSINMHQEFQCCNCRQGLNFTKYTKYLKKIILKYRQLVGYNNQKQNYLFKHFIQQLVNLQNQNQNQEKDCESGNIACKDCQIYETSLQKLEGQIRQHIRQEQLNIFQDNQEEKLDDNKKQKNNLKKRYRAFKDNSKLSTMKIIYRVKSQARCMDKQILQIKKTEIQKGSQVQILMFQIQSVSNKIIKKSVYTQETKENKIDWVHRISVNKDKRGKKRKKIFTKIYRKENRQDRIYWIVQKKDECSSIQQNDIHYE